MRKIILSLSLLLPFFASFAAPVDENTAKTVGFNFLFAKLNAKKTVNIANIQLAYKAVENNLSATTPTTSFFIFNLVGTKGFIIVSGDDDINPILGYSLESNYDTAAQRGTPIQLANWLKGYAKRIVYAIQHGAVATPDVKSRWQQLKTTPITNRYQVFGNNYVAVTPLLSTSWDQFSGTSAPPYTYNALCPYDNKLLDRTVTGCVATAMAQVMKYWNYPAKGTGTHTYIPATYPYLGVQTANFGGTTYNWSSMPNSLSTNSSAIEINAIATLMFDCGVSVDMQYGVDAVGGSGAYSINYNGYYSNTSQDALVNNFGYDNSLQGLQRSSYKDSVWIGMIKNELNAKRPVIYTGDASGGGHCFVADGYDTSNFIHFNWGWSGFYNGYYDISNLVPGGDTFNYDQTALVGIQPHISYKANNLDSLALVAFYDSTGGPKWTNRSGWLKAPLATWYGIVLNDSGRVVAINLSGNNLIGNITYSLRNLSKLTILNLSNNKFSGSLNNVLFSAKGLATLDLSYNQFTGTIPAIMTTPLPSLSTIDLSNNLFTGSIPNSFKTLSNLVTLDLSNNQLSGTLPSLVKDSSLSYLFLANNQFTGTVTSSFIAGVQPIYYLDLSNNKLTDTLPNTLTNLAYLGELDLSNNQLSGSIPNNIGNLSGLTNLDLSKNLFTGNIPTGISKLNYLSDIDLSNNKLSGTISSVMQGLTTVSILDISNNEFIFNGMNYVANLYGGNKSIVYAPQSKVTVHNKAGLFSVTVGGNLTNNTYKWYQDSVLVATKKGDSTYSPTKAGKYYVAATNNTASLLILYSDTISFYTTLPLTWLTITAKSNDNGALISWETANELNTSHFNIQYSIDGKTFTDIGNTIATGTGNNSYSFTDHYPVDGINFYRLESVDKDGAVSYSNVVTVQVSVANNQLSIAPNPARSYTRLHFGNTIAEATVFIYDMAGRKVLKQQITEPTNAVTLNIGSLLNGTYIVELKTTIGSYRDKLVVRK